MANYKGAGLTAMKKQIHDLGPEKEQAYVEKLTEEEMYIYSVLLTSTWISLEMAEQLLHKGAEILSPDNLESGLYNIGLFQARYNLAGIYKPILRIATIDFVVQQAARLWNTYFDQGQAQAMRDPKRNFTVFSVNEFPELSYTNRMVVSGYIVGTLEFTGVKDIRVVHHGENSQSWKWDITWK